MPPGDGSLGDSGAHMNGELETNRDLCEPDCVLGAPMNAQAYGVRGLPSGRVADCLLMLNPLPVRADVDGYGPSSPA